MFFTLRMTTRRERSVYAVRHWYNLRKRFPLPSLVRSNIVAETFDYLGGINLLINIIL